jgi:hypothetical protein
VASRGTSELRRGRNRRIALFAFLDIVNLRFGKIDDGVMQYS